MSGIQVLFIVLAVVLVFLGSLLPKFIKSLR
ncbi:putative membrane protein [Clostridium bornimense]|uniref:Putative membrane protein n=1 Tax=Clostridium bornimense TaxID=1216932 RepID=W6S5W7_9CLOT|nr:putative membrane protein [Clostridium bornimense]